MGQRQARWVYQPARSTLSPFGRGAQCARADLRRRCPHPAFSSGESGLHRSRFGSPRYRRRASRASPRPHAQPTRRAFQGALGSLTVERRTGREFFGPGSMAKRAKVGASAQERPTAAFRLSHAGLGLLHEPDDHSRAETSLAHVAALGLPDSAPAYGTGHRGRGPCSSFVIVAWAGEKRIGNMLAIAHSSLEISVNQMAHIDTCTVSPCQASILCRMRGLERLLESVIKMDADVLFPVLASLLHTHLDHDHEDQDANVRIRQTLDELELVMSLDIERLGLRSA